MKKNKKYVWDLLTDFKTFTKLIPGIADEVIQKDEKLKLNSELILMYNKEKLDFPLKVNKYQNEDDHNALWILSFSIINIKSSVKDEFFDIDSSKGDKSMFIYKHTFKKNKVTLDNLKELELHKLVIMKRIKKCCNKKWKIY